MSEPAKKFDQSPESYTPKTRPEILHIAEHAQKNQAEKQNRPKTAAFRGGRTMTKLQNMRVIEIPSFRAVSSGPCTGDELFGEGGFGQWMQARGHFCKNLLYAHPDFFWNEEGEDSGKSTWIWAVRDDITEEDCAPYEMITFEGGMYLVATADEDDPKDLRTTVKGMDRWIKKSGVFGPDYRPGHYGMCHMTGCGAIQNALGFAQQEIFLPLKFKER